MTGLVTPLIVGVGLLIFGLACGGEESPSSYTREALPTPSPTAILAINTPESSTTVASTPVSSSTATETPTNDLVALGLSLYLSPPANVGEQALWCADCHAIDGISNGVIGPDQNHIGTLADERIPGLSAEEYIRESILDPEAFIASDVERATPGLMVAALTQNLTADQVDALVAFLVAQK